MDTTGGGFAPAGADVSFSGTIDNYAFFAQSLTITAGTAGTVTFGAALGSISELSSLSVTAGTIDVRASIFTTEGQNYVGTIALGGDLSSYGSIVIDGNVVLGATPATISTAQAGFNNGVLISGTASASTAAVLNVTYGDGLFIYNNTIPSGTITSGNVTINPIGTGNTNIQLLSGVYDIDQINQSAHLFLSGAAVTIGNSSGTPFTFASSLNEYPGQTTSLTLSSRPIGSLWHQHRRDARRPLLAQRPQHQHARGSGRQRHGRRHHGHRTDDLQHGQRDHVRGANLWRPGDDRRQYRSDG